MTVMIGPRVAVRANLPAINRSREDRFMQMNWKDLNALVNEALDHEQDIRRAATSHSISAYRNLR